MLANKFHPELINYDRFGNRVDEVEFPPSWHWLLERAVGHALAAAPWESDPPTAHVRPAAGFLASPTTAPAPGSTIPIPYLAVPSLPAVETDAHHWNPLLAPTTSDPRL